MENLLISEELRKKLDETADERRAAFEREVREDIEMLRREIEGVKLTPEEHLQREQRKREEAAKR